MATSEKTVSTGYKQRIQRIIDRCGGQENLATAAGVTQPTVSRWLAGTVPYQKVLDKLCGALNLNPRWLLFNEQPEEIGDDEDSMQSSPGLGAVTSASASGLDTASLCDDLGTMITSWPTVVGALQPIIWERIASHYTELQRRVNQDIDARRASRNNTAKIYPYPKGGRR